MPQVEPLFAVKDLLQLPAVEALPDQNRLRDRMVAAIYHRAEGIAQKVVRQESARRFDWECRIDDILTSRWLGFPLMLLVLGIIFWVTISGANYPSELLAQALFWIEERLMDFFRGVGAPDWMSGFLVSGVYRSLAWVVSVMLPPMAIFFPIFTLLEDLGYLPRVAFNLDRFFKKAGTHGKQALTMSMGFGCNAAGVVACRIIDSPRERLIATLTNNFVPCNGRFPTLITLAGIFMGGAVAATSGTVMASLVVTGIVLVGIAVTLVTSWLLSKTLLRGIPSSFALELPPFRKPQVGQIFIRSLLDRTVFVLGRAVMVAAPAGGIIWLFANITVGETNILSLVAGWLEPLGRALGLDGVILLAFILGLPANEIVLPIMLMGYLSAGTLVGADSPEALKSILAAQGWTWLTALSVMLFSVLHYPCSTTLLTIFRETRSIKWTVLAALIPLAITFLVLFVINRAAVLFGLI